VISLNPRDIPESKKRVTLSIGAIGFMVYLAFQVGGARTQIEAGFAQVKEAQAEQGRKLEAMDTRMQRQEAETVATQRESAAAQQDAASAKKDVAELKTDVRAIELYGRGR
jgi:hypothetical protein